MRLAVALPNHCETQLFFLPNLGLSLSWTPFASPISSLNHVQEISRIS